MALGDALRAEREVHSAAACLEVAGDELARAGVDGAPEDDEGAVSQVRGDLLDGPLEDGHRRAEELVDRRADDDDHLLRAAEDLGVRREHEPAGRDEGGQQLVGAVLHERHLARCDAVEGRLARVVDADAQPGLGEGKAQRQADMAAAAEDDEVEVGRGQGGSHALRIAAARSAPIASPHASAPGRGENDGILVGVGRVPAGRPEALDERSRRRRGRRRS